jgi:hypothetical protein
MEIKAYNPLNAQLAQLKELAAFIPDASTKEGYEKSRRLSLDIGKVKSNLEKVRKSEKDYFLQGGKEVDSQAKVIKAELEEAQSPHLEAYKAVDNRAKIEKERRLNECQQKIDAMTCLIDKAQYAPSAEVADFIQSVTDTNTDEGFYELMLEAFNAKTRVLKTLAEMYENKQNAEAEAIELAELRALKAERDQRDHDERIKKEASEKADAEAKAAIEREEQAKRDQLKAEQDTLDAEKRLIEQEKQNKVNAENARIEAEARILAATKKAEQDAIDAAEEARLAEVARQEQEAETERLRVEKLEANKKHVGKIRGEIKDDLMGLGVDESLAKKITLALCKSQIRHNKVSY